ncbi:phage baseplate plug protein [Gluconobacter oxydans]|uniref:phage baseplate plug family protein n=1 Tax=Gluconobacter oxydans TaxID=442 RepID=UPI0039EABF96
MTAVQIPLNATASQTLNVILNQQLVRLDVYQRSTGLYMDVWLNDTQIVAGAICQNLNPVVHADYLGLGGDFVFVDTQGSADPTYDGLGDRYVLTFMTTS